jgi:hypothetical protein
MPSGEESEYLSEKGEDRVEESNRINLCERGEKKKTEREHEELCLGSGSCIQTAFWLCI